MAASGGASGGSPNAANAQVGGTSGDSGAKTRGGPQGSNFKIPKGAPFGEEALGVKHKTNETKQSKDHEKGRVLGKAPAEKETVEEPKKQAKKTEPEADQDTASENEGGSQPSADEFDFEKLLDRDDHQDDDTDDDQSEDHSEKETSKANKRIRKLNQEKKALEQRLSQIETSTKGQLSQFQQAFQQMQAQNYQLQRQLAEGQQKATQQAPALKPGEEGYELDLITRKMKSEMMPEFQKEMQARDQKIAQLTNHIQQGERRARLQEQSSGLIEQSDKLARDMIMKGVSDEQGLSEIVPHISSFVLSTVWASQKQGQPMNYEQAARKVQATIYKAAAMLKRAHTQKAAQKVNQPGKPPAPMPNTNSNNAQGKGSQKPTYAELKADPRFARKPNPFMAWEMANRPPLKPSK